jgi:hypothetical protein
MADSQNKDSTERQLGSSDRNMGGTSHPADPRSGQHVSAGSSGSAGEPQQSRDAGGQQNSGIRRETEHVEPADDMDRNDTQDAALELSDRGGIRPERDDPAEYTDRSRDRQVKE